MGGEGSGSPTCLCHPAERCEPRVLAPPHLVGYTQESSVERARAWSILRCVGESLHQRAVGGRVNQRTEVAIALRGCRVVTTSMTARLLLARQLGALPGVSWNIVTGDPYEDAPPGLTVDVVPLRRELAPSDVRAVVRMYREFRRRRFDFVQTHTQKASLLGLPAARLSGTTALYTVHGALYFADNTRLANVLGWLFERWCCAWADLVLVQSREDERALPKARICRAKKIRYIGNGIDLERFTASTPSAPRSSPLPLVLMVGRLVREKGCPDFFWLARRLSGKAQFMHVGPSEPDQRDAISPEELASVATDVEFVGAVDDIRPYLAAAAVVVLPSFREGIPRVAMEAAAGGRPVVAYDVRGVREVIDAQSGLLVPRGDRNALERVVGELLGDPRRREGLGRACRARVVERFSENDVVERLRDLYTEVASKGSRR